MSYVMCQIFPVPLDIYLYIMDLLPLEYWERQIFVLKILAGVLSVALLFAIVYFLRNSSYIMFFYGEDIRDFLMVGASEARKIARQWNTIVRRLNSPNESDWKLAIIEADKFIDEVVKNIGGEGKTLGERLRSLPQGTIQHLDELWEAHKVRNNIVHDPDFRLTQQRAREVIGLYEMVLKEFEVL